MIFPKVLATLFIAATTSATSGWCLLSSRIPRRSDLSTVSYDVGYDDAGRNLDSVACSDGINGLKTKGFTTQGSLPRFPYIGGVEAVAGWNSPNCGTCWSATWGGRTIYVLAVDRASRGLNIALQAMDALTGGQSVALGRVDAVVSQVDKSLCGL